MLFRSRSARYLAATKQEAPAGSFTVAVVCKDEEDDLVELVLLIPDGEAAIASASPQLSEDQFTVLTMTDVIMAEDTSISNCIEYRFGPDEPWVICESSAESMSTFRSVKFSAYEKMVRKVPVPCKKSLSRLLGNGPVDRMYDPNFLNPDREKWQVVNEDTGAKTDIPRPVQEMRTWNCETQQYDDFSPRLDGAPEEGDAAIAWFEDNVKYVKTNLGGHNTSLVYAKVWSDELDTKMGELGFTNSWTERVLSLNPTTEWGLQE